MNPMYCQSWLGIVVPPPPPPESCWPTLRTSRVLVARPARSVAFMRMMLWSQKRLGMKHGEVPPAEKIPSFATRSEETPSSRIWMGFSQGLPVPNQIDICMNTEFRFRFPSRAITRAYSAKGRRSCTGSIPEVDVTPSTHFSTKMGGLGPPAPLIGELHTTALFVRSTIMTVIWSVERIEKLL